MAAIHPIGNNSAPHHNPEHQPSCRICLLEFDPAQPAYTHTPVNGRNPGVDDVYHRQCITDWYTKRTVNGHQGTCPWCHVPLNENGLYSRTEEVWRRIRPILTTAGRAALTGAIAAGVGTAAAAAIVSAAVAAGGIGVLAPPAGAAAIGAGVVAVSTLIAGAEMTLTSWMNANAEAAAPPAAVAAHGVVETASIIPVAALRTAEAVPLEAFPPVLAAGAGVGRSSPVATAEQTDKLEELTEMDLVTTDPVAIRAATLLPVMTAGAAAGIEGGVPAAIGAIAAIPIAAVPPVIRAVPIAARNRMGVVAIGGLLTAMSAAVSVALGIIGPSARAGGALGAIAGGSITALATALTLHDRGVSALSQQNIALGLQAAGLTLLGITAATDHCTLPLAFTIISGVGAITAGVLSRLRR